MKRKLSLLAILVFIFSYSFASAKTKQEITFQDIPWYSSPEDTLQSIIDLGFIESISAEDALKKLNNAELSITRSYISPDKKNKSVPYTYCGTETQESCSDKLQGFSIGRPVKYKFLKTIAKQIIHNIRFLYTAEPNNPQLVEIHIIFQGGKDFNEKALLDALISAYGKPDSKNKTKDSIWLGENNTILLQHGKIVTFATLNGLDLANSFNVPETSEADSLEDTGF